MSRLIRFCYLIFIGTLIACVLNRILLVRSVVESFGGIGGPWSSALPLVSAATVTALGIGIIFDGLATYLG